MRKPIVTTFSVLAMMLAAAVVVAQEKHVAAKPQSNQVGGLRFVDASEVSVVNVEVTVTDKKGKPILDLKAEDFEILQDGRLQLITNFTLFKSKVLEDNAAAKPLPTPTAAPIATPTPVPTPVETPTPTRDPRFIAFYVDNENILPQNRNRVLNQVIEFLQGHLSPPDVAMVVSYQRSMKVIQPFTGDVDEVADGLRRLKKYTGGRTQVVTARHQVEQYIYENAERESTYDQALQRVEAFAREQRNELVFAVRSIQELVGMMSGLPGKKAIIYISDGLPMTPGLELYYELQDRYRTPSAISLSREYDSIDLFRSLATAAAASGVVVYSIDARGLDAELGVEAENRTARSSLSAAMTVSNYQDSLRYMADQTGGLAVIGTNDATAGLAKIAANFETYYFLGYRLVPTGEDRVHQIRVKVKKRGDYQLSYRQRFVEKSVPTKVGDRVMSGLAFDLQDNPMKVEIQAGEPAPADGGRWTLPVEVKVPIEAIALVPDGDELAGVLMVYYAARDDEGKRSDLQRQEHAVRMPQQDYEKARRRQWVVSASLLLEPGMYRISVGVLDAITNQAGYSSLRKAVHPEQK